VIRRLCLVAAVVFVVLLGYAVNLAFFPPPEATVQRYFQALQARNAGNAGRELALDLEFVDGLNAMARWQLLSDPRYQPPAAVSVGGWERALTDRGERVVAVQYDLAGTTHSSLLKLVKQDGKWRITNGTGKVAVNVPNALVNGQRLGLSAKLFPGIYQIGSHPSAPLLTAAPATVVVTPDRMDSVRLAPTLTTEALAKIKQYLDIMVKACETTMSSSKHDCPYKGINTVGMSQVKWTLVSLPELTVEQAGLDSVAVKGVGPGSVRLNAVGADGKGIDRVDSFSVNGNCVEDETSFRCTFEA
jgi:hypothetical protein